MQAVILAGGKGRRLEPFTTILPKPLMPLKDKPIMEIVIRQLSNSGVTEIIVAVGYLSHLIEAYFQNGERFGIPISYSREESPLGTAGPIGTIINRLQDDFLVLNGDLLTTINFQKLFSAHVEKQAAATIAMFPREQQIDFGVLEHDVDGYLTRYTEKPSYYFDVSMGINILNKSEVVDLLEPNSYMDIPDLMVELKNRNRRVYCHKQDCIWLDIGRMDDYKQAQELFHTQEELFL